MENPQVEENLVLGGDCNTRIGREVGACWGEENKEKERRKLRDEIINKKGRKLIELLEDCGWMVLNGGEKGDEEGEWTYEKAKRKSVIDLGIVN